MIPPMIATLALPEAEREAGGAIISNLGSLSSCVNQLAAALGLIDFADSERASLPSADQVIQAADERGAVNLRDEIDSLYNAKNMLADWSRIAAKSGAISIYEFHRLEQGIDVLLKQCPTLDDMIDKDARKEAAVSFGKAFPGFKKVRDFAAHGSEMTRFPEDMARHQTSDFSAVPGVEATRTTGQITNMLMGRDFVSTYEGHIVQYSLTAQTVAALREVLAYRYKMFERAVQITQAMHIAQMRQNRAQPPADQTDRQS